MGSLDISPLGDFAFGARVRGVDHAALADEKIHSQLKALFEDRGFLLFEDMEPSGPLQVKLAAVFGPIQEHAMKALRGGDGESEPGIFVLDADPADANIVEVDGRQLIGWTPWHYDACYSDKLYRGAVLRALEIAPEGGLTGFVDGIQLYGDISPQLRAQFEDRDIIYHPALMGPNQRFGRLLSRSVRVKESYDAFIASLENAPRAIHPAIWTRPTGEKVLHVSPWQAAGIEGEENAEGDALLEALCQEIYAKSTPYWHSWKPTDFLLWDNWRFIHAVSGHDPSCRRRMHRAGIAGDYGLGRWEHSENVTEISAS